MRHSRHALYAVLLTLAMAFVFASCGGTGPEANGTSGESATEVTTTAGETMTSELDPTSNPEQTDSQSSTGESTAGSTASPTARVTTTKAATAKVTTTKATTTAKATSPKSQTWNISEASLKALGLQTYSYTIKTVNSVGTEKNRTFTGVRLKDVLLALGADLSVLSSSATLTMTTTDDYAAPTYSRALILDDKTILAWAEDGTAIPLRMCPGSLTDTKYYVKGVNTITLNN